MTRRVILAAAGYGVCVLGGIYYGIVASIASPVDWPALMAVTLGIAPFIAVTAVIFGEPFR